MWAVRITIGNFEPFEFYYDDQNIKDYRAWQKFWAGRQPSFQIEFLGKVLVQCKTETLPQPS